MKELKPVFDYQNRTIDQVYRSILAQSNKMYRSRKELKKIKENENNYYFK